MKHPPNALAKETSPYLLQHAHNPVAWRAWGEEAFAEARRRDVPIFLSIGYSTCYWCHVMERECFESEEIARQMNDAFVCVKVDREERPDVDEIYMNAVVSMTGHGGWPMSVFLEPASLRPFWCGTYFPPRPMAGMGNRPTFPQVLAGISAAWRDQRAEVEKQALALAEAVRENLGSSDGTEAEIGVAQVTDAASSLLRLFDRGPGGFGRAPKFPQTVFIDYLLDLRERAGDETTRAAADEAVRATLDAMAIGGIRDQIGGGFHRYSVDASWTVPHFEKMLYDNGLLAGVYARAARLYGDGFYEGVVRSTLDFVLREMTGAGGGFLSAQDAEVDSREGLNYVWTPDEVRAALDEDEARFALAAFGMDEGPNFRDPHHPDELMTSVLRLADRPERVAATLGMATEAFARRFAAVSTRMLSARGDRKQPGIDDKVIVSWNGLMASGFAAGYEVTRDDRYLGAARAAMDFVFTRMRTPAGELRRSWRGTPGRALGVLEDYAFVARALIDLVRVDEEHRAGHLARAIDLVDAATRIFGDSGGFRDTPAGATDLFVRARGTHDGAVPSGSSVMIHNLIDLWEATRERRYLERACDALASMSGAIARSPVGSINATRALLRLLTSGQGLGSRFVASEPSAGGDAGEDDGVVEIYAGLERVVVGPEQPASVTLLVKVKAGYHVVAADPGVGDLAESLVPLRVGISGGGGVAVYADYPAGREFAPIEGQPAVRVCDGEFELPVVVECTGEITGRPLIVVTYQACGEASCLAARTVELDVAIDRA